MSDRHVLPPYSLRMPAEIREKLEDAAIGGKRSLNAEIVARLEETFEIEEVLSTVAPGAPVFGTAGLLSDLDEQLRDQNQENIDHAVASASAEITGTLSKLECLPYLTAILALKSAYPEAMTEHQRERLVTVIGRMIGSDSKDPGELMNILAERLIVDALEDDLGM